MPYNDGMRYITGEIALNIPCTLDTCGDWHRSSIDWSKLELAESEDSIFGSWGIGEQIFIPELSKKYNVANTIRACLDLIDSQLIYQASGMNNDYICNESYDHVVFEKVKELKAVKNNEEWERIDRFMRKEYLLKWVEFIGSRAKPQVIEYSKEHVRVMYELLQFLNKQSSGLVLSGSAALYFCYKLDRVPKNLDLIGSDDFETLFAKFCELKGYTFSKEKEEKATKQYSLEFDTELPVINIAVSYRKRVIDRSLIKVIDHITIYDIGALAVMKAGAYLQRDKITDIYDLTFIINNYWDELSESVRVQLTNALAYKGMDYFKYIVSEDYEPSIDVEALKDSFVKACDIAGVKRS